MSIYTPSSGRNLLNIENTKGFDINTRNPFFASIVGFEAGVANQGMFNTLMGYKTGNKLVKGANNVMYGAKAGVSALGSDNVLIGTSAGENILNSIRNILVGTAAGRSVNGNNNILIGYSNTTTIKASYTNLGIGNEQKIEGSNNIAFGYKTYVTASNGIFMGSEIANQGNNNIIIGNGVANTGCNVCIIMNNQEITPEINPSNSNWIYYNNSNNYYTNFNNLLTGIRIEDSKIKTTLQGDLIQIQATSNIDIVSDVHMQKTLTVDGNSKFTTDCFFLDKLALSHSNFDNVHWVVYIEPKSMETSDFVIRSKNNTIVTFTDDFQSELLNFTGKHRCSMKHVTDTENTSIDRYIGRIVSSTGKYKGLDGSTSITIDESLPCIELSNKKYDTKVFGVISGMEEAGNFRTYKIGNLQFNNPKTHSTERKVVVNSHGEGAIWVCDVNGPLKNGDLITSSGIKGYGMRQGSQQCMSYSVAKITCDCDFSTSNKNIPCKFFFWNGKLYKKAFVGCVYKI